MVKMNWSARLPQKMSYQKQRQPRIQFYTVEKFTMRLVVSAKRAGTPTAIQRRSQLTSLTSPIGRPFGTRRPRCGIQFTIKASSSAKEAVEVGLVKFQSGDVDKALELFAKAQALNPTDDEARAACYNAAW